MYHSEPKNKTIKLKSDTAKRKRFFTPESFSHPAKCHIGLLEWIVLNFTTEGEIILDPMLGSGTTLYATLLGRSVIGIELEAKFCKMAEDNLTKLNQCPLYMGTHQRGTATILQGDARNLTGILADKIITSPPYASGGHHADQTGSWGGQAQANTKEQANYGTSEGQIGQFPYGQVDKIISSPPYEGSDVSQTHMTSNDRGNPANPNYRPSWKRKLAEGYADTKRPYVDAVISQKGNWMLIESGQAFLKLPSDWRQGDAALTLFAPISGNEFQQDSSVFLFDFEIWNQLRQKLFEVSISGHLTTPDLLASFGSICPECDTKLRKCLTSPIYGFLIAHTKGQNGTQPVEAIFIRLPLLDNMEATLAVKDTCQISPICSFHYSQYNLYSKESQIGNLKSTSYLSAMLQVYQQCHAVLRSGGLMILVLKNFIRNKQQVRLDLDTIKLCEQAGFTFQERWYRELTQMSFWRRIYHDQYPEVEPIKYEDVLVFTRG